MNVSDSPTDPQPIQPNNSVSVIARKAGSTALIDWPLNNSVEPAPCFQWAILLQAVDQEQDLALELLALVLAHTPGEVLALERALTENDSDTLGRILHSQKASFEVFGLQEVVDLGRAIEQQLATQKTVAEVSGLIWQYARLLGAELGLMRRVLKAFQESGLA